LLLSGENQSLAHAEANALLDIYSVYREYSTVLTQLMVIEANGCYREDVFREIMSRAGYVQEAGKIVSISDSFRETLCSIRENYSGLEINLRISIIQGLSCYSKDYLRRLVIENTGIRPSHRSEYMVHVIVCGGLVVVGEVIARKPSREYYCRRPSTRPFFRSTALPVKLARAMINLARAKRDSILLDPFCGTGSVLVEAASMGIRVVGIDIDYEMASGSRLNLRHYGLDSLVVLGDSLHPMVSSVDSIVTDPPYGRAASTFDKSVVDIYRVFIDEYTGILRPGGYMVFLTPHYLVDYVDKLLSRNDLIVDSRHYIYVHSGLTRIVYVVYRY